MTDQNDANETSGLPQVPPPPPPAPDAVGDSPPVPEPVVPAPPAPPVPPAPTSPAPPAPPAPVQHSGPAPVYGATGPVPGYAQPAPGHAQTGPAPAYAQTGPAPGYPQGFAAPGQYAPVPQRAPMSKGAKRGLIIGGISVGVLGLLVVGGVIAVNVLNGSRGPEQAAVTYLEHIAAGRAEAANAMVDPRKNERESAFLTDEVLGNAVERISDIKVVSVNKNDDAAAVQLTYQLDGATETTMLLAEKGDPEFLFLDTWKLTGTLVGEASIMIDGTGDVLLAGKLIEVEREGSYAFADVALYPAVYTVAPVESKYVTFEPTNLVMKEFFGSTSVSFTPTDEFFAEIQQKVDDLVAGCLASTAIDPEGCPFDTYSWGLVGDVSWTLVDSPTVNRDYFYGSYFGAEDGVVRATFNEEFFGETTEQSREVWFSVSGEAEIQGDQVVVYFEDGWW